MSQSTDGVTYKYYLSTFHRNEYRNRPVRVSFDASGAAIAVERIHPLTGELEVMEQVSWRPDNNPYEQEIDLARFEALRERMLAPPSDEMTYEYFLYALTLVRIAVDSQGNRRGAEYVERSTGEFIMDHTWMSKIEFDWNAEAEEIDRGDFEQLHELVREGDFERFYGQARQAIERSNNR